MELNFLVPIEEVLPKEIKWNYEEFLTEAKNAVEKYNGLIYEDSQMAEAKTDRANIRNYIKSIEDARKQIKSAVVQPYMVFERQIKDVIYVLEGAVESIDVQVKAFEEDKKAKKKLEIENAYTTIFGELTELVPLEKIWDNRWLNVSAKMPTIEEALTNKKTSILEDMEVIFSLRSEDETDLLAFYFETFSVAQTLAKNKELKDRRELVAKAKETPEIAQKLNNSPIVTAPKKKEKTEEKHEEKTITRNPEQIGSITLKFTAPLSKLVALRKFVDENEIEYIKL